MINIAICDDDLEYIDEVTLLRALEGRTAL